VHKPVETFPSMAASPYLCLWPGKDLVFVHVSVFWLQELRGESAAQDVDAPGRCCRGARAAAGGRQ